MYLDSSPLTTRRSAGTRRRRSARRDATPEPANATAGAARPGPVAARRTRMADAIVSQWLLEQLPSDRRHVLRSASDPRRDHPV